jgi:hypothetical protein
MTLKEQRDKRNEQLFLLQEFASNNEDIIRYYDIGIKYNWILNEKTYEVFEELNALTSRAIEILSEIQTKIPNSSSKTNKEVPDVPVKKITKR